MNEPITHLVIARACALSPEGANAEVRLGVTADPNPENLDEIHEGIVRMFKSAWGEEPGRVGIAVLPWIAADDDAVEPGYPTLDSGPESGDSEG